MNGKRALVAIGVSAVIAASALVAQALPPPIELGRVSATQKGSLLIYPKIEMRWNEAGVLVQDTFFTITNDFPEDVDVQFYFVNGDAPTFAVWAGDPPQLIERSHPGWNSVDCQLAVTREQPAFMSAATGLPVGCQPWPSSLDPGDPPGRPDPENPGARYLRGFVIAFAVDPINDLEITHNHLAGSATLVNYAMTSAWEYNAYAFQRVMEDVPGAIFVPDGILGICGEYECGFGMLLFDFYASGSLALSMGGMLAQVDTDLTLMPITQDVRQDSCGPVITKAKFDIWNMNETRFSGTERCITCWNQTLLSKYVRLANHFLRDNLQTDKGKARIDGMASTVCDDHPDCPNLAGGTGDQVIARICPPEGCSEYASLLGVAAKRIVFASSTALGIGQSGINLVGMGTESGMILYDNVDPPPPLRVPITPEIGASEVEMTPMNDAVPTSRKATRR